MGVAKEMADMLDVRDGISLHEYTVAEIRDIIRIMQKIVEEMESENIAKIPYTEEGM